MEDNLRPIGRLANFRITRATHPLDNGFRYRGLGTHLMSTRRVDLEGS